MKVLVLLCHPDFGSFCFQISQEVCAAVIDAGAELAFHNLYKEEMDPVLSVDELKRKYSFDEQVQNYMTEVQSADVFLFIHPDWWGQMPALLKGWIDRVFRPGIVYDYEGGEFLPKHHVPLLTGKKGLAICTTDEEKHDAPHSLYSIWQRNIFSYCGINGSTLLLYSAWNSDASVRKGWISQIRENVTRLLSP